MKTNQENRLVSEIGYSTVDHLQTINQLIEKCNEFERSLYIGYIDYERHLTPQNMKQYLRH